MLDFLKKKQVNLALVTDNRIPLELKYKIGDYVIIDDERLSKEEVFMVVGFNHLNKETLIERISGVGASDFRQKFTVDAFKCTFVDSIYVKYFTVTHFELNSDWFKRIPKWERKPTKTF